MTFYELLGKAVGIYVAGKIICFIWTCLRSFIFPIFGWCKNLRSYGDWAVVTGATDGIGKGYAKELARKGLKLVLISRSQDKLDSVQAEIREAYKVEVKTIAFDFGATSGYEKIESEIQDLDVGILVNNVGMSAEHPDYFNNLCVDSYQKMLNVNMLSVIKMTHMVLKRMLERKKGVIVHISSGFGSIPGPFVAVYSASKAFVDFFARALHTEYKDQGIISQAMLPHVVATKMAKVRPSFFVPDAESYARQAVKTIGIADRSNGFWFHTLQSSCLAWIPACIVECLLVKMMKGVRAKALKRKNKSQ